MEFVLKHGLAGVIGFVAGLVVMTLSGVESNGQRLFLLAVTFVIVTGLATAIGRAVFRQSGNADGENPDKDKDKSG